jgi:hypothetical protein
MGGESATKRGHLLREQTAAGVQLPDAVQRERVVVGGDQGEEEDGRCLSILIIEIFTFTCHV